MSDLNQVTLTGRLGRDPESRQAGSNAIWAFSVGVSESTKKGQEWVNETRWVQVEAWGDRQTGAPPCAAHKGDLVFVSGKIDPQSWEDRETKEKRYKVVVKASTIRVMVHPERAGSGRSDSDRGSSRPPPQGSRGGGDYRGRGNDSPRGGGRDDGPPPGWDDGPAF